MAQPPLPVVLLFGGTDPSGGAGLQADIQTVVSLGGHPASVVTAVTAQDTTDVKQFTVIEPELVIAQARAILEDMPVAACKTGMLGDTATVSAIAGILDDYPDLPLVVDPVLATNAGAPLTDEALEEALRVLLLPRATVVTPNSIEARLLAPAADNLDACAQELLATGCGHVLITGTHEQTAQVVNRLYGGARLLESYTWERLPHDYHGSGCTLAAAVATGIAHGLDPVAAVAAAQSYTWHTLKHGYRPGMGQYLPDRFYRTRNTHGLDKPPRTS